MSESFLECPRFTKPLFKTFQCHLALTYSKKLTSYCPGYFSFQELEFGLLNSLDPGETSTASLQRLLVVTVHWDKFSSSVL